jgi:dTDP-4-amino-4,6-dideoxygalactose transaminase
LKHLVGFINKSQTIAEPYRSEIDNPEIGTLVAPVSLESHVYHLFVITCSTRDQLIEKLKNHGIASLIQYPVPTHHQKPCRGFKQDPNGLAYTVAQDENCLSIPFHPQMAEQDVVKVIKVLNDY